MLKLFELSYLGFEPFLPAVNRLVRRELRTRLGNPTARPSLLDVGGRKSHVTIGVDADVTVTDLPRESDAQKRRFLGIDDDIVREIRRRRSNVRNVVFDDMTRSIIPSDSYDVVVAVEVLEHVEEDDAFVRNVARILKPGGQFLMTTPNGDFIPRKGRDHKRHYKREQLESLLAAHLDDVEVWYAVRFSDARLRGLKSWSLRHPARTLGSMIANLTSNRESTRPGIDREPAGTCHLFAWGKARRAAEATP